MYNFKRSIIKVSLLFVPLSVILYLCVTKYLVIAGLLSIIYGLFLLNIAVRRKFYALVPNVLRDSNRNYCELVFGSTSAWSHYNLRSVDAAQEKDKVLSFAFYRRSLIASKLILLRYHSYLKGGGKVVLHLEKEQKHGSVESLSPADIVYLHPVTISILGIQGLQKRMKFPLFHYPRYICGFILNSIPIFRSTSFSRVKNSKPDDWTLSPDVEGKWSDTILWIYRFCCDRDIEFEVKFIVSRSGTVGCKKFYGEVLERNLNNLGITNSRICLV